MLTFTEKCALLERNIQWISNTLLSIVDQSKIIKNSCYIPIVDSLTSMGTKMAPNAHIKGYRQSFFFNLRPLVTIYKIWIYKVQPVVHF